MKKRIYASLAVITALLGACSDDDTTSYSTNIFATGADLNTGSSVHFAPNGDMLVIDTAAKKIHTMNPDTGEILSTFTDHIDGPADIDFSADGTMYWTNAFAKQAYKKSPDGTVSFLGDLETVTDGIAVNAEGRVFASSFEVGGRSALWEIDSQGVEPARLVGEDKLGGLDAYDFGPDGYLYAPDFLGGSGQVFKIDVESGAYEIVADGFCQPIATKFNALGELHVLDYLCPRMFKVDINTGEKTLIANVDGGPDNFDFSPQGDMYIAFVADAYIGKLLPDGSMKKITTPGLSSPGSISIRSDGSLFVSDGFAMRRYDTLTGTLQQSFYTDTGMIPPFTMADDGQNLILTCHLFNTVQVWDPVDNKAVNTYAGFQSPTNAISFLGEVIVAEAGSGKVIKLADKTALIEGLTMPAGLVAQGDNLYVSDRATGIVWKAVESGLVLSSPVAVAKNLSLPEGIAIDQDGKLLVMETGAQRLVRIDLTSNITEVVADNLDVGLEAPTGVTPTGFALAGVTVSDTGVIYATGEKGNVIYQIEKN